MIKKMDNLKKKVREVLGDKLTEVDFAFIDAGLELASSIGATETIKELRKNK